MRVVLGLGNPGEKHQDTPHNVGHRIVEALADDLGAEWLDEEHAAIAHTAIDNRPVLLVKPKSFMNKSGPAVMELSRQLGFSTSELLLIHDDMDMPLGKVRARLRGVDGGHRGLRSIFETLGTNEIRRVKLGVAPPPGEARSIERLTRPFTPAERAIVDQSYRAAVDRTLEIVRTAVAR